MVIVSCYWYTCLNARTMHSWPWSRTPPDVCNDVSAPHAGLSRGSCTAWPVRERGRGPRLLHLAIGPNCVHSCSYCVLYSGRIPISMVVKITRPESAGMWCTSIRQVVLMCNPYWIMNIMVIVQDLRRKRMLSKDAPHCRLSPRQRFQFWLLTDRPFKFVNISPI